MTGRLKITLKVEVSTMNFQNKTILEYPKMLKFAFLLL